MNREEIDIVKRNDQWIGESGERAVPGTRASRKDEAVRNTARVARADSQPVTVRIRKENGRIQEERTYPATADPRRSKARPRPGRGASDSRPIDGLTQ